MTTLDELDCATQRALVARSKAIEKKVIELTKTVGISHDSVININELKKRTRRSRPSETAESNALTPVASDRAR